MPFPFPPPPLLGGYPYSITVMPLQFAGIYSMPFKPPPITNAVPVFPRQEAANLVHADNGENEKENDKISK